MPLLATSAKSKTYQRVVLFQWAYRFVTRRAFLLFPASECVGQFVRLECLDAVLLLCPFFRLRLSRRCE